MTIASRKTATARVSPKSWRMWLLLSAKAPNTAIITAAAARDGDFDALVAILHPEVVFQLDSGPGTGRAARPPIHGGPAVARQLLARGARIAPLARLALVNGGAGFFVVDNEAPEPSSV